MRIPIIFSVPARLKSIMSSIIAYFTLFVAIYLWLVVPLHHRVHVEHLNLMEIIIDIDDPIPLFTQLIGQIKQAVQNEKIHPGDPLPSIRQLANDLELNSKTVAKAYKLLERDAVIQAKGYRGTFIHPDAKKNCVVDLNEWVTSKLDETITAFRKSGVTDSEIRIAFSNVMNNKSI